MTTTTPDLAPPDRSLQQRMEALARGNEIRSQRAQLKREIKAGRQPIHELLLHPPRYLLTARVFDLLLMVPKYGRVKTNKILSTCRISPSKTFGGLSERQRAELVSTLRGRRLSHPAPHRLRAVRVPLQATAARPEPTPEIAPVRGHVVRVPRPPAGQSAGAAPRQPWEPLAHRPRAAARG